MLRMDFCFIILHRIMRRFVLVSAQRFAKDTVVIIFIFLFLKYLMRNVFCFSLISVRASQGFKVKMHTAYIYGCLKDVFSMSLGGGLLDVCIGLSFTP